MGLTLQNCVPGPKPECEMFSSKIYFLPSATLFWKPNINVGAHSLFWAFVEEIFFLSRYLAVQICDFKATKQF